MTGNIMTDMKLITKVTTLNSKIESLKETMDNFTAEMDLSTTNAHLLALQDIISDIAGIEADVELIKTEQTDQGTTLDTISGLIYAMGVELDEIGNNIDSILAALNCTTGLRVREYDIQNESSTYSQTIKSLLDGDGPWEIISIGLGVEYPGTEISGEVRFVKGMANSQYVGEEVMTATEYLHALFWRGGYFLPASQNIKVEAVRDSSVMSYWRLNIIYRNLTSITEDA